MEESKALHRLQEASDLVGMVEDLLNPGMSEKLSGPAWAGLRITLRNVREMIQSSQTALSQDLVGRSKVALRSQIEASSSSDETRANAMSASAEGRNASPMTRRDLKASLEKFIDRQ